MAPLPKYKEDNQAYSKIQLNKYWAIIRIGQLVGEHRAQLCQYPPQIKQTVAMVVTAESLIDSNRANLFCQLLHPRLPARLVPLWLSKIDCRSSCWIDWMGQQPVHLRLHNNKHLAQWPSSKWWTSWKVVQKGQSQMSKCSTLLQTRVLYHREHRSPSRLRKRRTFNNININMQSKLSNSINNWLFLSNKSSSKRTWLKLLSSQMYHHKKSSHLNLLPWIKPSFPRSQASLAILAFLRWEALTLQKIYIQSNRRSKTKSTLWSRRLQEEHKDKAATKVQQWLYYPNRSIRQGKASQPKQQATEVQQTTLLAHREIAPRS